MARTFVQVPTGGSGPLMAAESGTEAGQTVLRQTVEACPPRKLAQGTFTRPADTNIYAVGDSINNSTTVPVVITFANVARFNGGSGEIVSAFMVDSANQATKLDCELWLFNASPVMDNDNAAFTPSDAELLTLQTIIDFKGVTKSYIGDATAGAGGNVVVLGTGNGTAVQYIRMPFVCGAATTSLFGVLVARNTYTPVSAEAFTFNLAIEQV